MPRSSSVGAHSCVVDPEVKDAGPFWPISPFRGGAMSEVSKPGAEQRPGEARGTDEGLPLRFVRPQAPRNLTLGERAEERTSTWLELFFDLCFVVAVAALARGLHDEPNLGGALRFLGLFVPVWWSWMIFTWYATGFDNDDVPYRVTLLVAMLSILGLAASVEGIGVEAVAVVSFVLAYALMRFLVAGLFLRAGRHVPADPQSLRSLVRRRERARGRHLALLAARAGAGPVRGVGPRALRGAPGPDPRREDPREPED